MPSANQNCSTVDRRAPKTRESSHPEHLNSSVGAPAAGALFTGLETGYLGSAVVLGVLERPQLVLVQWEREKQTCLSWARLAMASPVQLKPGNIVLVISQNLEEFYVVGFLDASVSGRPSLPAQLQTPSGARVAVTQCAAEEVVQIHSSKGALVMEYHPESGKTLVNVENGDLEFVTQNGSISLKSAQKISLEAHRLETRAETVVAKAENVYETVEELIQVQTGRMRTLVKESCHLKARDAFLKAEQDFKVDGEQIHLG